MVTLDLDFGKSRFQWQVRILTLASLDSSSKSGSSFQQVQILTSASLDPHFGKSGFSHWQVWIPVVSLDPQIGKSRFQWQVWILTLASPDPHFSKSGSLHWQVWIQTLVTLDPDLGKWQVQYHQELQIHKLATPDRDFAVMPEPLEFADPFAALTAALKALAPNPSTQ